MGSKRTHLKCGECPIRERAVCAYCGEAELNRLNPIKSYKTYAPGQEIVASGEETDFVGSIVTGVVKLTKTLADGRTQMVGLLFPSDFVGNAHRRLQAYDAIAATEVTLCLFQKKPFNRILKETVQLESRLLEMTLDELDAARDWMLLLGRKTAREKVASFLVLLARRAMGDADSNSIVLRLPLTRAEIAEYLGMTIETVSRQMSKLNGEGIISIGSSREIQVPAFERLVAAAEGE
ncbi:MAG: helix-turn-helix domain-containing protein [Rhizobiales bacterium]|nr:helix-turn-helix domain-containing protein [Hyphomicrobiales bacterium]